MARSKGRTGRPWRRAREQVLSKPHLICGICGHQIDKTLKHPDPMSASVDHIDPLGDDGAELDPRNLQPAHYGCNSRKGRNRRVVVHNSRKWFG